MQVPVHRIGSANSERVEWPDDDAFYAKAREAAEAGEILEPSIFLGPNGGPLSSWEHTLLNAAERGWNRLRRDGVKARLAIPYRIDVVATGLDVVPNEFPWDVLMRIDDPDDHHRRVMEGFHHFGRTLPPMLNSMGTFAEGFWRRAMEAYPMGTVSYTANYRGADWRLRAPWIWKLRAVLLDPSHEMYLPWIVEALRRKREEIRQRYPGLAEVEFALHSKDAHYQLEEDGSFVWAPFGDLGRNDKSSGILTVTQPYIRTRNAIVRARTLRAIELARIPAIPRFWIESRHLQEYLDAIGPGQPWIS